MRVCREALDGTDLVRLTIVDAEETHRHPGECAGYWCPHCGAHDETLRQVVHEPGCQLVGEHGRAHYDGIPDVPGRFCAAIDPEHPITMIRSAETHNGQGVHNGEVIAFECDYCGNGDETVGEICHDEDCPLADAECDLGMTDVDDLASMAAE